MTFSFMVAITFMLQFLHGLLEFKYPKSLDYRQLIKRWIPVFILSGLAFLEYFLSGAYYFTYFLAICLILLFIACLGTMSKYIYVLNESKKQGFNTNTTDALFYLNWKVRNLCSSDQVSDTFLLNKMVLLCFLVILIIHLRQWTLKNWKCLKIALLSQQWVMLNLVVFWSSKITITTSLCLLTNLRCSTYQLQKLIKKLLKQFKCWKFEFIFKTNLQFYI